MNTHLMLLYFATWSLVALAPGPAVMCAMTQATRYGFQQALLGILGIQLGHLVFFACVASGLATLLANASVTFTVLRILGALYLLYLGIRIIATTVGARAAVPVATPPTARRNLLLQGFAIQMANPKALLFMSALLPQFIQPHSVLTIQLIVLLAITIAVDVVVLTAYAIFALRGARSLRASGVAVWLERVFGAALILFSTSLIASARE
jgi:homoserine/homoserine lactone efflux protein